MEHKIVKRRALGNPRRGWKQENFILSTFSPTIVSSKIIKGLRPATGYSEITRRAVKTCVEAGFNLLELGWASEEMSADTLAASDELGVGVVYQDLWRFGGMGHTSFAKAPVTKETIKAVIAETKKHKSCIGYYIWDEPYLPEILAETRKEMDWFEEELPTDLFLTLAIPSYNPAFTWQNGEFAPYVRRFLDTVDPALLSLDYYPVGDKYPAERYPSEKQVDSENQLDVSLLWCDLGLLHKLSREYGIPMWFYYQGYNLHKAPIDFTDEMVRAMMNAGALHGAKALQQYTAYESVVDLDGGHGPLFDIHREMTSFYHAVGNTLMALDCRRVIHDDALLPGCPYIADMRTDMSESELLCGKLPFRVSISESADTEGNLYLMVLNRDFETAKTVTLDLKKPSRLYRVSPADGTQSIAAENTNKLTVDLIAGEMAIFRVQDAAEAPFTVEYVLEK